MWLRVNRRHHSRDTYLALLAGADIAAVAHPPLPDAIRLETPCNVGRLPGFDRGWVTVQDASAQGCTLLLAPQDGETTHILEIAPAARVTTVDVDGQRAARIHDNLQRLGMQAKVVIGDGRAPDDWRGNRLFDRIQQDAPCSATGVIRRHPDIKWLRRDGDIAELTELQQQILYAAWRILKPGGTLLYATCSILPEKNRGQITAFLANHPDARLQETGDAAAPSLQCLQSPTSGDGFFYAKMIKGTLSPLTARLAEHNGSFMKIIILGAGQVGGPLAENLVGENNDITIVDTNPDQLQDKFDLRAIQGHGFHPRVLRDAGAGDADMLVAVTNSDETNIIA